MKTKRMFARFLSVALGVSVVLALAPAAMAVTIETVTVGNTGNLDYGASWNRGSVDYEYKIGKYEVSNAQWAEFLNAVLPNGVNHYTLNPYPGNGGLTTITYSGGTWSVTPGQESKPIRYISLANAYRFANWMSNGQPSGQLTGTWANDTGLTEQGPYAIEGRSNPVITSSGSGDPPATYVDSPEVAGGERATLAAAATATWVLPTPAEWVKACWHKNDGDTGNYWDYATGSDTAPTDVLSGTGADEAVWDGPNVTPTDCADVDNCGGVSAYGAMGMAGNTGEMIQFNSDPFAQGYDFAILGGYYSKTSVWHIDSTGTGTDRGNPSFVSRGNSVDMARYGLRLVCLFSPPPAGTMFIVK